MAEGGGKKDIAPPRKKFPSLKRCFWTCTGTVLTQIQLASTQERHYYLEILQKRISSSLYLNLIILPHTFIFGYILKDGRR